MVSVAAARSLALALPEASEEDHHGFPSFRIRGKIFATFPEDGICNVMLDEQAITAAIAAHPDACEEQWWGKRLTAVRVRLAGIRKAELGALLHEAWRRRAPKALL